MNKLPLIIKREFINKVRNKSFIVMTFLSPLLFLAMTVLIGYLASLNKDEASKIAIHDTQNFVAPYLKTNKENAFTNLSKIPLESAKKMAKKDYEGILYIPKVTNIQDLKESIQYISDESASAEFILGLESVIDSLLTTDNLKKNKVDIQKIETSKVNSTLKLAKYSGDTSLKFINEIKIGIGFFFGYLIMMFIIIYGNFVMRSVIEEKTNRIIEIIISSVKPFQLMMGKIIGNSLAGILQFLVWAIVGLLLFFVASATFGTQSSAETIMQSNPQAMQMALEKTNILTKIWIYVDEIKNSVPIATIVISFLFYFLGGYFLYSSLYAAIGAAVDNETDSQQFLLPIIMPLMLGVYIGFFTVINDPHGTVATVFSMIPFTSPIVMLMRIPFGVPIWQILVSLVSLYITFLLVVWFASKIYRIGILMYGKKPTWKELYKWLKY
jgi:ABC-2 type transport system permease protein